MLDFDKGGYKEFQKCKTKQKDKWEEYCSNKEEGLCYKHKEQGGYIFLLPIPNGSNDKASTEINLAIEDLLSKEIQNQFSNNNVLNKNELAKESANFKKCDFNNFIPIFDIIEKIIRDNTEQKNGNQA